MLSTNEDEIAAWLAIHGPIAVALNANPLQYYTGGVLEPRSCDPAGLDHAVLLVGYGTAKNNLGVEKKYWLVKNSWGPSWVSTSTHTTKHANTNNNNREKKDISVFSEDQTPVELLLSHAQSKFKSTT